MTKLKAPFILFLTALFTLLLTACSSDGGGGGATARPNDIPSNAITIDMYYSAESDQYMPEVMRRFNQSYKDGTNPVTGAKLASGERPVYVIGSPPPSGVSSGGLMQGIVNGALGIDVEGVLKPTMFQPSVSHWLSLANLQKPGLFNIAESPATALSPVVIGIWEDRLLAIQQKLGKQDIGWQDLLAVLKSPNGWEDFGIPGRKAVYFGHSDPRNSSTSLSGLISEYYACARENGFTGRRLELIEVGKTDVQDCVREIELLVRHYARRTEDFLPYVSQGPDYLDFLALEETDVICLNTGGRQADEVCNKPPQKLVAIYPEDGTFIHEHPIAIVNGDWVTDEQKQAAKTFTDFVLMQAQQELIMSYGFRPANPNVPIGYPFVTDNGVSPEGPKAIIDIPDVDVLLELQNSWSLVRKQADVTLLIDVSGSMEADDKIGQARVAAEEFLGKMEPTNRIGLTVFSDAVRELVTLNDLEQNESQLRPSIRNLRAEGGTELFMAVRDTVNEMNKLPDGDRIRAIVLLSDGEDTGKNGVMLNDAIAAIEASKATRNPIIVVPVLYGRDISSDLQQQLNGIARASKTQLVFGNSENITRVLDLLSAYF